MDMNNLAITVGTICGAIGTLIGGFFTLYWTKGTDAQIKLIRAQSDASHRSQSDVIIAKEAAIAQKEAELKQKDSVISLHENRIKKLEDAYEALLTTGHEDRNKWYEEQLRCAKESAQQQGQITVLQAQLAQLLSLMASPKPQTPVDVTVRNDLAHPVPTTPQLLH